MRIPCYLAVAATALICTRPALGQLNCSQVRTTLTSSTPSLELIQNGFACADFPSSVARAVTAVATTSDTARLSLVFVTAAAVISEEVVSALVSAATASTTTPWARMWAMHALNRQLFPDVIPPGPSQAGSLSTPACAGFSPSTPFYKLVTPISRITRQQIYDLAVAAYRKASYSNDVRAQAFCLWTTARRGATAPAPLPSDIELVYVCGNRFLVRSKSLSRTPLTWDVVGSNERGTLNMSAVSLNEPYRELALWTESTGSVRMYLGGSIVQTRANGGTTCTT
jgi:hypothetical protein